MSLFSTLLLLQTVELFVNMISYAQNINNPYLLPYNINAIINVIWNYLEKTLTVYIGQISFQETFVLTVRRQCLAICTSLSRMVSDYVNK